MDLIEAARLSGGTAAGANPVFRAVSSDSRTIAAGELFVALRGERFDGHDFVAEVLARGAVAAMVDADWAQAHGAGLPLLAVADSRLGLGALAAGWRTRFQLPLIGVTGSNGKTTVKEMCAAILHEQARRQGLDPQRAVLATSGNLNNDIGMPQMLLKLDAGHRAAVLEMGMNRPGEIRYLTTIARPTVAVISNAQRAHLAGLGSLSEVARAKGEIFEGLAGDGTAVVNADDPHCALWRELAGARPLLAFSVGGRAGADVVGRLQPRGFGGALAVSTPAGAVDIELQVPGCHNAANALAAIAATLAGGAALDTIAAGLAAYRGIKGRLQRRNGERGALLIDDSYNANPDSMRAAIDVLAGIPGHTVLVMGDMGETGEAAAQFHDEVGGYAKSQGIERLFALGDLSAAAVHNFGSGGQHFSRVDDLLRALRPELGPGTTVLVKGSRFMRMERIVDALDADLKDDHAA